MSKIVPLFLSTLLPALSIAWHAANCAVGAESGTVLVDAGRAKAVIVPGNAQSDVAQLAAEELQWHIERASGVRLPILSAGRVAEAAPDIVRLIVGGGSIAEQMGIRVSEMPPEQYRIKTVGSAIVFAGADKSSRKKGKPLDVGGSPATLYAVCHLLDRHLGVRWLWPGEVGTYVPKQATVVIPPLDVTAQPDLLERSFLNALKLYRGQAGVSAEVCDRMLDETAHWSAHHQLGGRSELKFGHAFTSWWEKYREVHPDYFAVPPPGAKPVSPKATKLCTSKPAVVERIISEWKAAGMPDSWNVSPNDGLGFCSCERCRALDEGGPYTAEQAWNGEANLTGRHVVFYNTLLRQMRTANPGVTLCSLAYSSYRNPPTTLKLEKGLALDFVHSYTARDQWRGWSTAGAGLALRPNWLHSGAIAPYLPLRSVGDFMRFARSNDMLQFRFDSLHGYWATQGPNYYLIARLGSRPDLTVDDVIAEYASAFGNAAPAIRRWLDYWEQYSRRCAISVAAGGEVSVDSTGLYEATCRQLGYPTHPLLGSWRALEPLYNDAVLAEAEVILDEAQRLSREDKEVCSRILFLRDGLRHLRLTRDVIALAYQQPKPDSLQHQELNRLRAKLNELRIELSPRHVVWGDVVTGIMKKRGILPEAQNTVNGDLRGF